MISNFFIDRPIFASVLSIVLVLAGIVAWRIRADVNSGASAKPAIT